VIQLDVKRDLYNLSLSCRALEDMVTRRLYAKVDVELSQERELASSKEAYLLFRPHVVRSLQELTVRGGSTYRRPAQATQEHRGEHKSANCVRRLLEHVPEHQLISFRFLHSEPLDPATLGALAAQQKFLQDLQIFELDEPSEVIRLPRGLRSFGCRSVTDGEDVGAILKANRDTLEALTLGQESGLVQRYQRTRTSGFLQQLPHPSHAFTTILELHNFPRIRSLNLSGINLVPLIPSNFERALPFCDLTRLSIESCHGSDAFLETLSHTFDFVQNSPDAPHPRLTPQLKDFLLRNESPTGSLREKLTAFLAAFSGLRSLTLLFENASLLERPSNLIGSHGPTLETLVLEVRVQPRLSLSLDTSRPLGAGGFSSDLWTESITDICSLCPNLVELGIGFPWNDEFVRVRKTPLPTLKRLKTVHIRNFPESQVLSQLGDYTIKEHATKFVEWVFPIPHGADRPTLETLAIGPTIYEGRWRYGATRKQPPEWARTNYFLLDWAQTRFKKWSCLVSPVSEKCVEELRGEKPLGGVFEGIWIN
jgi:hypothetical protein